MAVAAEAAVVAVALSPAAEELLPRELPFVGLLRHAPPRQQSQPRPTKQARLDPMVGKVRESSKAQGADSKIGQGHGCIHGGAEQGIGGGGAGSCRRSALQEALSKRLRESPYIGFCRHAPPSPVLNFARGSGASDDAATPDFPMLGEEERGAPCGADAAEAAPLAGGELPGRLPTDLWASALANVMEPSAIPVLARLSSGFREALRHPVAWQGAVVRIEPAAVPKLAPVLIPWAEAWQGAAKFVIPRSEQLRAELGRLAPSVPIEVAWRFDAQAMGDGLALVREGEAVRRIISDDEGDVVVVGDAPLVVAPGRPPYIEVCLEAFAETECGDGMNQFGIGITACNPQELEELGSVAAEVPDSWVVDFTQTMVCLSVNNCEEDKGFSACSESLTEGTRVGLGVAPSDGALEVYINGELRDRLFPPAGREVPVDAQLFPVLDLFGRVAQISRTSAEAPSP